MLTIVLVVIHVLVSLALILFVLLLSGRGGGLSDMFGGSVGRTAAGSTVVERILGRLTVLCIVIFSFTTLALGLRLQ